MEKANCKIEKKKKIPTSTAWCKLSLFSSFMQGSQYITVFCTEDKVMRFKWISCWVKTASEQIQHILLRIPGNNRGSLNTANDMV